MTTTEAHDAGPVSSGASEVDPTEFRQAMSDFATGVTVVTGLDRAGPAGFACQSFASVSVEPPLVMFCVDRSSGSWARIRQAGRFCVNVLGEHQDRLCERFGSRTGAKFVGSEWLRSGWNTAALPDVLMRVHADIQRIHRAGDHDIVLGSVLETERPTRHRPMIFFRSGFGLDRA